MDIALKLLTGKLQDKSVKKKSVFCLDKGEDGWIESMVKEVAGDRRESK